MTRAEFSRLLADLVTRGVIADNEAAELLRRYDRGDLDNLPAPVSEAVQGVTEEDAGNAWLLILALLGVSLGAQRPTIAQPGQAQILSDAQKVAVRDRRRDDFDAAMKRLSTVRNTETWEDEMRQTVRDYHLAQTVAGVGRPLTMQEVRSADAEVRQQEAFLHRYAGELAALLALGKSVSSAYVTNRNIQYGGTAWGAYWRAEEKGRAGERGTVVYYRALDDDATCSPCLDAENGGPYLPGSDHPYPGDICLGRGYCRCVLEYVYDLDAYARLGGT